MSIELDQRYLIYLFIYFLLGPKHHLNERKKLHISAKDATEVQDLNKPRERERERGRGREREILTPCRQVHPNMESIA